MPEVTRITDQIFTVSEFLTPNECDREIEFAESIGFSDAPITTSRGPQLRPDVRNNTRVMADDMQRSEQLWDRAKEYPLPEVIERWCPTGVNERLRFYRYDTGQQFDWHYDGAFERENGERSFITFMIYLNDDYEGGHTSFEEVHVHPEKGMALLFVHQIRHKGQPVTKGRKYVIRTDVMYQFNRQITK